MTLMTILSLIKTVIGDAEANSEPNIHTKYDKKPREFLAPHIYYVNNSNAERYNDVLESDLVQIMHYDYKRI